MTERDIQNALYDWRVRTAPFPIVVPNIYLWRWESDLIYLSRSFYATEYEIKLTHSDFLADRKKVIKHDCLAGKYREDGPSEFFYVCPRGVIVVDELPPYAGLMYIEKRKPSKYLYSPGWLSDYKITQIRRRRRKNAKKLNDSQIRSLLEKGVTRYWSLQRHIRNNGGHPDDAGERK